LLEDYNDKLDAQAQNYLQRVRAASQRMAQLIDDMLNLSRVSRGEMRHEQIDLSQMARDITEQLQKSQPERIVEVEIKDGIKARGDDRLVRIALENLLGNAWKFTSKQPSSRIEFGARAVTQAKRFSLCATMAQASIWPTRTSCSALFKGFTQPKNLKARASASPPCSASYIATADAYARKASRVAAQFYFTL
jgi:signal transduction histidine kinase